MILTDFFKNLISIPDRSGLYNAFQMLCTDSEGKMKKVNSINFPQIITLPDNSDLNHLPSEAIGEGVYLFLMNYPINGPDSEAGLNTSHGWILELRWSKAIFVQLMFTWGDQMKILARYMNTARENEGSGIWREIQYKN